MWLIEAPEGLRLQTERDDLAIIHLRKRGITLEAAQDFLDTLRGHADIDICIAKNPDEYFFYEPF